MFSRFLARWQGSPWGDGAQRRRAFILLVCAFGATLVVSCIGMLCLAATDLTIQLGALLGSGLTIGFFGLAQLVQAVVAECKPSTILWASVASFVVRVTILGVILYLVLASQYMDHVNPHALMASLLVCTTVWIGASMLTLLNLRIPVYDFEYQSASSEGTACE